MRRFSCSTSLQWRMTMLLRPVVVSAVSDSTPDRSKTHTYTR
jgi:hypothetical protein